MQSSEFSSQPYCAECLIRQDLTPVPQIDGHICKKCMEQQQKAIYSYKHNIPILHPSYHRIQQQIFLGNQDTAMCIQTLQKQKIHAIIACGKYLQSPFQKQFEYQKYEIDDDPQEKILPYFDTNYDWMKERLKEGKNILLHCAAGVSRSASFTIAFLMKNNDWSFKQAHQFVFSKRKVIYPNSGFRKQLQQYQQQLKKLTQL